MNLDDLKKQLRGPRQFDTWVSHKPVQTTLGPIPVTFTTQDGEPAPDQPMVEAAGELSTYVQENADWLLDLIYAHYLYAQAEDWLEFWDVPEGLQRGDMLKHVDGLELEVSRLDDRSRAFDLSVSVRIQWDKEHGLHLIYWCGTLVSVNDDEALLARLTAASAALRH